MDVSLNSFSADKEFTHWYCTFSAFICSFQANNPDRLDALVNFVFPTVHEYIVVCDDYELTIDILKELYNEVFAWYIWAIQEQKKERL